MGIVDIVWEGGDDEAVKSLAMLEGGAELSTYKRKDRIGRRSPPYPLCPAGHLPLKGRGIAYGRTKDESLEEITKSDSVRFGFVLGSIPRRNDGFSICDSPALKGGDRLGAPPPKQTPDSPGSCG